MFCVVESMSNLFLLCLKAETSGFVSPFGYLLYVVLVQPQRAGKEPNLSKRILRMLSFHHLCVSALFV